MNKKKTIIFLVIGILVVITMSIGVTYSYMKPKVTKDSNETEIGINNCAKITLKDNDSTINLTNMYPMEEEMGLQTEAYEFTISSTCEEYTGFNLYLLTYSDNQINDNNIRYGITSKNDTVLETNLLTSTVEETELTEAEKKEINQGVNNGYSKIYKIYSNNIPLKGESEYKLHIWIDEKAENTTMNKNIKIGVIVKGYQREETMAEYLIAHKDNTLIYHDGLPDYEGMENYELEAEDLSYRFSGANPNNYVCLNSNNINICENDDLYRIIGLFKNDLDLYEIKLIKYDYSSATQLGKMGSYGNNVYSGSSYYRGNKDNFSNIDGYFFNNSTEGLNNNMWQYSNLNKINLNDFYYNYLINRFPYLKKCIVKHNWIVSGIVNGDDVKTIYENEIGENKIKIGDKYCYEINDNSNPKECTLLDLTYESRIALMYLSDYVYAISPNFWINKINSQYGTIANNNWIYMGLTEWILARYYNNGTDVRDIYMDGASTSLNIAAADKRQYAIRPVFYLNNDVKLKNINYGTLENPYQISL